MNKIQNCRICMKVNENLIEIDDEHLDYFYSVTQMKLIKLENASNSICSFCIVNLKHASDYRNDLINIQNQIFKDLENFLGNSDFLDPIRHTEDLNTILLIKEEPEEMRENFMEGEEEVNSSESERVEKLMIFNEKKKVGKISCEFCDKKIKKYYYKRHLMRIHPSKNHLTCDICNHQSNFKTSLEVHMTKHFNTQPFSCSQKNCKIKFRTKKDLRVHLNNSHRDVTNFNELFICETCGKSFKLKKLLEVHLRSNHTLERPFKCDEPNCTAAYFCNTNLLTHKKRAHSNETVTCEVCAKNFGSLINLNEHVRKNHKEGRYACPEEGCLRKFITPYYLSLHTKTHYGIRDRECQFCGQRFFNKKHLNQHVEVAHKKSRFFCQVEGCSSIFSRKCNIREHVKKIHRDLTEEKKQELLSEITKMKPIYMTGEEKI